MSLRIRWRIGLLCLSLSLAAGLGSSQAALPTVQVTTTTLTLPTYGYAAFLYAEHSDLYNMDYDRLDWGAYEAAGPHAEPHDYTAVVVENAWLRLTFLPELGGRLYGVTVKATGEELLYQNPVIKPTHWGPPEQGWWLAAGGIEWCLPVEEHGYEWGIPWVYSATTTVDGATVALWDTTATDRVRARIVVHLPDDRATFTLTPRLENPSGAPVAFKFWHNAMLAPGAANTVGEHFYFVFPIDQVTVHSRGDPSLPDAGEPMSWPEYSGTDYSRLGNWNRWLGFFARPQAAEDWAGVYAEGVLRGVARVFPPELAPGLKGFGMGWSDPIDWHNWTDDGSTYVELHAGPSPTFWDSLTLPPGGALEWTETWLPVHDLPRLSLATADVALGLKASGSDLDLGVVLAGQGNDVELRLWRAADCTLLWRADGLVLAPGEAYTHQVAGLGLPADQLVLGVLEGSRLLALSGELVCPQPASEVSTLDTVQPAVDFAVAWEADDPGGVLTGYDVQVRDGDLYAPWTVWLTGTAETTALFHGQPDHTYAFRSRARDLLGRVEPWPVGDWADTFTTVLLEPAPVLITSSKRVAPQCVAPGQEVEYRIQLNNTGSLAASARVTDSLPADLELVAGPWITPTLPPPVVVSGTLTWQGSLAAGQSGVVIGWTVRVASIQPSDEIANVVWLDDGVHSSLWRKVDVIGCQWVYLPVVAK